ncbi:DEAD/DEAH box helicase [Schnuerera ultunensis]|uniref:SNF2-related protein n=1 Tax=[Clostridium] ultunense Esp TaxID=1288971 RepID=A0A1M4PMF2_9FIRM|nr:DEAD/DEAH box helicase [Schnuerera ultunensis]SHD76669.1 SNF2-related protein [[Clostridium] ultunense Esp]
MLFRREKIKLESRFSTKGIVYDIIYKKGKKEDSLVLPIYKNKEMLNLFLTSKDREKVLLLEELWLEELLYKEGFSYILKYINLYNIEKEILKELDLPYEKNIKISLRARSFLGNENFKIDYIISNLEHGILDGFYERIENIIFFEDRKFLLSKEQLELLDEIDNCETGNVEEQGLFLAKVKKKAIKAKAEMDDYILNEECYFPEELNVDLKKHSEKYIELIPYFKDLNEELNKKLVEGKDLNPITSISQGIKRKRLFFDETIFTDYNKIKMQKNIVGSNVPKLIDNPYEFLPDSIDLEEFSDRVKGLKIRTYRAIPFIHCKEGESTGWFDFDTGVNIRSSTIDEQMENDEGSISIDEFQRLVEEASEKDENYIYYNNKWLRIDYKSGFKFLKADEKLKDRGKKIDIKSVNYILDIFDNIITLEYNRGYINLKERYGDKDLLTYEKPKYLNASLFVYQQEGYKWLRLLKEEKLGGLLADDMGLGKTLQLIAYMAYLKEIDELRPSLIVVPAALTDNWCREINKFTYNMDSIYIHKGSDRVKNSDFISQYDIVITSYETLIRDQIILGKIHWKVLAVDEAQKIKNATTLSSSAVKAMKSNHVIAITGTPVENNLSELWSIVDFVQPGLLGSYSNFKEEFQIPIEKNIDNPNIISLKKQQLISRIEPILLRRTKEEKLENLPKKAEKVITCRFSSIQENMYMDTINKIKSESVGGMALAYLQELIQICSHPRLVIGNINIDSNTLIEECNKLAETLRILERIKEKGEKAVIFTKYKDMQKILVQTIYDKLGIWSPIINGEVTKNRLDIIEDFEKKPGFNTMILSPRAAGVGLNIVGANHVIHYTREWNPAVESQATDRVHRVGQKKDVKVYYPICISEHGITVEVKLNELLNKKKILAKEIIIPMEKLKINERELLGEIVGMKYL